MGKNRGQALPTMTEDVTGEIFLADNYENGEGNIPNEVDGRPVTGYHYEMNGGEERLVLETDGQDYFVGISSGYNDSDAWANFKQDTSFGFPVIDNDLKTALRQNDVDGEFYKELIEDYNNIFSDNYEYGDIIGEKLLDKAYDNLREAHPNWNGRELSSAYDRVQEQLGDTDPSEYVEDGLDGMMYQLENAFYEE